MPKKKRMKLPNGFGRITKLTSKRLRKPYRAMVTVGKDENGRPIGKLLKPVSYFSTYNDAYEALMEYNKSPYDFENSITLGELFDKWYAIREDSLSSLRNRDIKSIWTHLSPLYDVKVKELTTSEVRSVFDPERTNKRGIKLSSKTFSKMKVVLSQLLDFAVECEITDKNIVRNMKTLVATKKEVTEPAHKSFSDEDFNTLKKST